MKKIVLITFFIFVFFAAGCSSSDTQKKESSKSQTEESPTQQSDKDSSKAINDIDKTVKHIDEYITTPKTSQPFNVDMPKINIDSTPPTITETQQQPYKYDKPAPQMPQSVESPGPLPKTPDPVVIKNNQPTQTKNK